MTDTNASGLVPAEPRRRLALPGGGLQRRMARRGRRDGRRSIPADAHHGWPTPTLVELTEESQWELHRRGALFHAALQTIDASLASAEEAVVQARDERDRMDERLDDFEQKANEVGSVDRASGGAARALRAVISARSEAATAQARLDAALIRLAETWAIRLDTADAHREAARTYLGLVGGLMAIYFDANLRVRRPDERARVADLVLPAIPEPDWMHDDEEPPAQTARRLARSVIETRSDR